MVVMPAQLYTKSLSNCTVKKVSFVNKYFQFIWIEKTKKPGEGSREAESPSPLGGGRGRQGSLA